MSEMNLVALTAFGLEAVVERELERLGARDLQPGNRAVAFRGDLELLYRANLHLRAALRVLHPIHSFAAANPQQLYRHIRDIDWSNYLTVEGTLAVDAFVHSKHFTHSKYAALKVKDAIVDQFRERTGKRPSVDVANPALRLHLHIAGKKCTLSLDSSGESLHRRGYRFSGQKAPLNEALAAGLVLLSGWDARTPLYDPMCGSGTLAIEAAMLARKMAPGLLRKQFAFQRWRTFDAGLWQKVRDAAKQQVRESPVRIFASDKSKTAVATARENLRRAGLQETVELTQGALEHLRPQTSTGFLIMNPPYGERMQQERIDEWYAGIGDHLKQHFTGFEAWVLSANKNALKRFGLRPSKKYTIFNGGLECKFQRYELYAGSRKAKYREKE